MKVKIKRKVNELFALKPPGTKRKIYNMTVDEKIVEIDSFSGSKGLSHPKS